MQRPNGDIEVEVDDIDRYYFFPYTDYEEYDHDDPLYALVAVVEEVGDVVIYNRPGSAGTYHSMDPNDTTPEIHPPTDAFKTALAKILTNPGTTQDISDVVCGMHPWEHHQLEIILSGLNSDPDLLPIELKAFINGVLDEMMNVEIEGGSATDTEFKEYIDRASEFYYEVTGQGGM